MFDVCFSLGWTYLLQFVDSKNSLAPGREAYDAFLARWDKNKYLVVKANTLMGLLPFMFLLASLLPK
jgi:hypothetical protein